MRDETIIKLVAILSMTSILIVNFFTMKVDSTLTGSICAIIGGIAGYEFGRRVKEEKKEEEEEKE